jgi:hypothetical protein
MTTNTQPTPNWEILRAQLMALKRKVYAELSDYPRQIAGCDIQFQRLSARRDGLIAEVARLDAARDAGTALAAFITSAPDLDAPHP